MERVNGNNPVDIGGGRRGFRNQNTTAGIQGTEVTANFLNDVQEEISAVIEKTGLALDPQDQEQLYKALMRMVAPGFGNRLAWMPVLSVTVTAPPASPVLGNAYIIPAGATGVWAGKAQQLAEWNGTSWNIIPTKDGHGVGLPDGRVFERVGGTYVEILASRDWVSTRKTPVTQLNSLPWLAVLSMTVTTPPASPAEGDLYLIAASPTGAWAGKTGQIAEWSGGAWAFKATVDGHGISLPDGRVFERIGGTYVEKIALDAQSGKWSYALASGTANALIVSLTPIPPAYLAGLTLQIKATGSNTGAATINVNALGEKAVVRPDGSTLSANDILSGSILLMVYDGSAFRLISTATTAKIRLTGPLTVWVRPDGNDSNDGSANTAAKAFKTLDGAMDAVKYIYDTSGFAVIFRLGVAGTYAAGLSIEGFGSGVNIIGDVANRNSYVLTSSIQQTISNRCARVVLEGVLLENTYTGSSQPIFYVGWPGSSITLKDMGFRRPTTNTNCRVIYLSGGASVSTQGSLNLFAAGSDVTIEAFIVCDVGSTWVGGEIANPTSIGLTNMVFSRAFCAVIGAQASFAGTSFAGVSRGKRYEISLCGAVNTAGAGANFLPGDTAGTINSGGVYV